MSKHHYDHIRNNIEFHSLVSQRSRLGWILSILILIVYYSFILVIAFSPSLLGIPISEGGIITWGLVIGIGIILFTFLITGIYVHRSNHYDLLLKNVVDASQTHVDTLNKSGEAPKDLRR